MVPDYPNRVLSDGGGYHAVGRGGKVESLSGQTHAGLYSSTSVLSLCLPRLAGYHITVKKIASDLDPAPPAAIELPLPETCLMRSGSSEDAIVTSSTRSTP